MDIICHQEDPRRPRFFAAALMDVALFSMTVLRDRRERAMHTRKPLHKTLKRSKSHPIAFSAPKDSSEAFAE
jgi:hypothetical protein